MKKEEIEIQRHLISTLLHYPDLIPSVDEIIAGRKVFKPDYQKLYALILSLWEAKSSIDPLIIESKIEGELKDAFIECMVNSDNNNALTYARLLVESYLRRVLYDFGKETSYRANKTEDDIFELMDWVDDSLSKISNSFSKQNSGSLSLSKASQYTFAIITRRAHGDTASDICTGIYELDKIVGTIEPGDLVILAGRPSNGKTALALGISDFVTSKMGMPTDFFSLEMSTSQLVSRLISKNLRINGQRINLGRLTNDELKQISVLIETYNAPLFIDDCAGITIGELRAKLRKSKRDKDIGLAIIDYIQLVSGLKKETREQEVASITRILKATAKELHIPIIALSQLSRAGEIRTDKKPILSDLRDSGAIEQDADIVIFIHSAKLSDNTRDLIVAKHRNGPVGEVTVKFRAEFSEFT